MPLCQGSPFIVITAVDASAPSLHAFDFAANLVSSINQYKLVVVYVTALNRTSKLPMPG
jgi:hypothetical protein